MFRLILIFLCFFYIQRYHDGTSALPNTSDLLALLHTNSPLSLIHRYLDINTINPTDILEKIQKTIVCIDDLNDRPKGKF